MAQDLAKQLGFRFIERRDVKAVQHGNGSYEPERTPWRLSDLVDHIEGKRTLGHYLVSPENKCRLFAFDIDLVKGIKNPDTNEWDPIVWPGPDEQPTAFMPREAFLQRDHWAAPTLIAQLNALAEGLARRARKLLEVPVAIAYSGSKGLHVYAFTGSIDAADAKASADFILESFGVFERSRGHNFWKHTDGYEAFEIEVFPKQGSLDGKDLGNLMRLPLGVNRKTGQHGFFVRAQPPLTEFTLMDSAAALDGEVPWQA